MNTFVELTTWENDTLGVPSSSIVFPNGLGAIVTSMFGSYSIAITIDGQRTQEFCLEDNLVSIDANKVEQVLNKLSYLSLQ